ncbi:MAG: glycoside hydrolase [Opitutaceae bacterium]|nr:glycoside hydrolase [Opitutaceae bacterium]
MPDGYYASTLRADANRQTAYRSADGGATWSGPSFPFGETGKHHSAPLIVDGGSGRLFAFETLRDAVVDGVAREAAYGFSVSDDSGVTWSAPEVIRRADAADTGGGGGGGGIWNGVGVIPATQTAAGTWVIGFHHGRVLRGGLAGGGARRWTVQEFPRAAHPGFLAVIDHLDELGVLATGGAALYAQFRTNAGFLGEMRSADDALTWGAPALTPLAQPDAPPMLFRLSDGRLFALHHNRAVRRTVAEPVHSGWLTMPAPTGPEIAERRAHPLSLNDWASRAELWFSLSSDDGATWGEPRLLLANALDETLRPANPNYQCSYADVTAVDGVLHVFVPHRWQKVVHVRIAEARLGECLTRAELRAAAGAG